VFRAVSSSRTSSPRLSDDQPIGPHPQGFADETRQRNGAGAFEIRLPRFEAHVVRMVHAQLGDVLDRDDPLVRRHQAQQRRQQRGLARTRRARTRGCCDAPRRASRAASGLGIAEAATSELVEVGDIDLRQTDRYGRARARDGAARRGARAVLPPHVDHGRGVVEVAPADADERDGQRAQLIGIRPPLDDRHGPGAAVDEQAVRAVDEHVRHLGIAQEVTKGSRAG
jgi:hypothetical protein